MYELPKTYDPHQVEERRYQWELERGDFEATIADDGRPRYCITIPPPNITGSLHMGHALNNAIHDVLLRWKRMQGYNVLCVPGTDHAGIPRRMSWNAPCANKKASPATTWGARSFWSACGSGASSTATPS